MSQDLPTPSDVEFGQFIVAQGFVTSVQVRDCLRERYELGLRGVLPVPRLGELLVARGFLTLAQCERARKIAGLQTERRSDEKSTALPAAALEALDNPANDLGRYIRVGLVGEGGMAEVWRAWDRELSRWVAMKILRFGSFGDLQRFQKEAQTVARLSHPAIAAIYDAGIQAGRPYLAMQFIDGRPLYAVPRLNPALVIRLVRTVCDGVHYAHTQGIVHRDLKPHNIIVEDLSGIPGGSTYRRLRPFIVDFGLAKDISFDGAASMPGNALGTPLYMSPEQAEGRSAAVGPRSDVYSIGATLYSILAGRPPFEGRTSFELLERVIAGAPPGVRTHNPGLDRTLESILAKCLEKDPERRYASAAELGDELERYLGGEPVSARPPGMLRELRRRARKHPALKAAIVGALAATLLSVGLILPNLKARDQESQARETDRARALRASELCRLAMGSIKEAKALWRVKTSRRDQWERFLEEADTLSREALTTYPQLAACHETRGELYQARGRWQEAVDAFREALRYDPRSPAAWYELGVSNVELFNSIVMQPGIFEVGRPEELMLALRERQAERHKKDALDALERFRALSPAPEAGSIPTRFAEAAFALAQGRYPDAERRCDELLLETQTDERLWLLKAKAACFQQHYEQAKGVLDRLTDEVMPQLAEAWALRGWVLQKLHQHTASATDCSRAMDLNPALTLAQVTRAWARSGLSDFEGAEADAAAVIERDHGCGPAYYARGWAREMLGNLPGAVEDYSALLALYPHSATLLTIRGWARERQGDSRAALEDYRRVLSLGERKTRDHANCARVELHLKEGAAAVANYTEALRDPAAEPRLLVERGQAYMLLKNYDRALQDFRAAEQQDESLRPELVPLIQRCETPGSSR